jgi:adenylate cyclase
MAVELAADIERDDVLPAARAGLSFGPALARDGDYFGPTVNLAARIVNVARPSTVVVSDGLARMLTTSGEVAVLPLASMHLKGIGRQQLWGASRRVR